MPKQITPLPDLEVGKAKPQAKETKLFDGGGLFLLVLKIPSKPPHKGGFFCYSKQLLPRVTKSVPFWETFSPSKGLSKS